MSREAWNGEDGEAVPKGDALHGEGQKRRGRRGASVGLHRASHLNWITSQRLLQTPAHRGYGFNRGIWGPQSFSPQPQAWREGHPPGREAVWRVRPCGWSGAAWTRWGGVATGSDGMGGRQGAPGRGRRKEMISPNWISIKRGRSFPGDRGGKI